MERWHSTRCPSRRGKVSRSSFCLIQLRPFRRPLILYADCLLNTWNHLRRSKDSDKGSVVVRCQDAPHPRRGHEAPKMSFELTSAISEEEPIAISGNIRKVSQLSKSYRAGRWRKLKGRASVRLGDGSGWQAEARW